MNRFWLFLVLVCWAVVAVGQKPHSIKELQSSDECPVGLRFNADGRFKIVQFTDTHFIAGDPRSVVALECIANVLDAERPDLVVLTGDIIYGKDSAEMSLRTILDLIAERNLPFAATFGNHDDEQGLSRLQLFELIRSYPQSLTSTTANINGVTNYALPLCSSDGSRNAFVLYCFDSNSYSQIEGIKGYDYVYAPQIEWYARKSAAFRSANGDVPLTALAFFHIPLPEYAIASSTDGVGFVGTRLEKVSCPALNSGLFTAFREHGDVKGIFVGHDHDNDYAAMWNGILLAYGRFSGGNTTYNNLAVNGARVIELTEQSDSYRTWIRLRTGETLNEISVPDFFMRK